MPTSIRQKWQVRMGLKTQKIATKMKIKVEVKFHDEDEWGIMLESYTEKTTFPFPFTLNGI